jgi:two-component system, NarL family, response regulator
MIRTVVVTGNERRFLNTMHPTPELTDREIQVLDLIARGNQNKEIAHTLKIAEDTAKIHVKHIFNKLGVQNRTQAVAVAIHRGIIQL